MIKKSKLDKFIDSLSNEADSSSLDKIIEKEINKLIICQCCLTENNKVTVNCINCGAVIRKY